MTLEYRHPLDSGSQTHSAIREKPIGGIIKRSFDLIVALLALVFLGPLFLMVALLIKFSDGGPVFSTHERIGYGGRAFGYLKFRTEPFGAENAHEPSRLAALEHTLRRTGIDELPLLLNILRGDMSLVGPRPLVSDELQRYSKNAANYTAMRPGLTGLWQMTGNMAFDAGRVELDAYYLSRWSFLSDLKIIVRTLPVFFYGISS